MIRKYISGILLAAIFFMLPCLPAHALQPAADVQGADATASVPSADNAPPAQSADIAIAQDSGKAAVSSYRRNAYQRLRTGKSVRIAVLGDSIAAGAGAEAGEGWVPLLDSWLRERYPSRITLDNYGIGGTGSYTGYYLSETAMGDAVREKGPYDLVIICYGHNDAEGNFALCFEAMLRSVRRLNPSCQFITVLESSQRTYTPKMQELLRLSEWYGADVADTLSTYDASGLSYEELTLDDVHPNASGHRLYFETIKDIIEKNTAKGRKIPKTPAPSSPYMTLFEDFTFHPLDEFKTADGQYLIMPDSPTVGIVFKRFPGAGPIRLDFSTGEIWEENGNTDVPMEWLVALPVSYIVAPGTAITLTGQTETLEDTVLGFVFSGCIK